LKTQGKNRAERYPISRYLNARFAYWPSIASDGRRIAFLANITGVSQVWQVQLSPGSDEVPWPDQLTFEADRVIGVWFSPAPSDERLIYARDLGGNEKAQFYVLHVGDSTELPLTAGYEEAMHLFGEWSRDGTQVLFAANRRDPGHFDLYVQPLDGEARLVWRNDEPGYLRNLSFSPDGGRVVMTRMSSSFCHDLIEVDLDAGTARLISPSAEYTRYNSVCYAPDGRSLFLNTDLDSDYLHIVRLNLDDLTTEPVVSLEWDAELMALSPEGRYLAYAVNVEGASELRLLDLADGRTRIAPGLSVPPGVVGMADSRLVFSSDSSYLAFSFTNAIRTYDIYVWDLAKASLETDRVRPVTQSSHGGIPVDTFLAPELVHYPTFDRVGEAGVRQIPAWFYKPAWRQQTPMPVILFVHGGPESQFRPFFHFLIQYLLSRGYGVLAPNVRGSTGYGKAYSHLDDVEKRMDSVADLAHAATWLKEQPDVDGDRLAVYGGSYGGFMVLSALATYPDLWAAAVDIVGISNFVTFLENTSDYRRAHREAEYGSLDTDRKFLQRISPLNHVGEMAAPLFVIHGANDPRVPLSEAEQLVEALSGRGIPVEFLVFDDEGHGLAKLKNKLVAYPAVADFLDKHLKGDRVPAGVRGDSRVRATLDS
jgi:dipeptidyl aminopeptidase/acylaminoacyl peptidase